MFVTWDGPQVSYLEGLFLPIFRLLERDGWAFHVLQYSWGNEQGVQRNRVACEAIGIPYRSVEVWRKPVSAGALLTAFKGQRDISKAVKDWNIDILMPRSTLPLFASLRAMQHISLPLVFDADGLPIDERVEFGGMSPFSLTCRFLRDIESLGLRKAKVVLTRTEKAAEILHARAGAGGFQDKFFRVTNGRDSDQFSIRGGKERTRVRSELGVSPDAPLMVYAGSLGRQYCLPEMFALFMNVLAYRSDARLLLLTGSPEMAVAEIDKHSELKEKVIVRTVDPDDVPFFLASADLGLGFRKPSFSMSGVAPIKLGEYLLCGVPVVATRGVGDTASITQDIGYLIQEHDSETLEKVAAWFVEEVLGDRDGFRARAREFGKANYSLQASVDSYRVALNAAVGDAGVLSES